MSKLFNVELVRSYIVTIEAESKEDAEDLTEFYIGSSKDLSTVNYRRKYNFNIKNIDLRFNGSNKVNELKGESSQNKKPGF